MANYATNTYQISGSLENVLAAMKTKLNTLDSTNNPIVLVEVQPYKGSNSEWVGYLIYD